MPAVTITGLGAYLPLQKLSSSELDVTLKLPPGSVEKNQGYPLVILPQQMKQPHTWVRKQHYKP